MTAFALLRRAATAIASVFLALAVAAGAHAVDTPAGTTTVGGTVFFDAYPWSGYRHVDQQLLRRLHYAASADWGVHAPGAQYFRAVDWNQVRSPKGNRASGWSA
ncbi:hypothetical protein ACO2Q2_12390 [Dyella sp. KRB-257]|uniref:hypothetical protein n=1 Tax=Dyella sp. KRB-257 TaxID=3400915 RepID=UPI003BFA8AB8